ncbi:hypothetical protein EC973_009274 [Apophysomyces ossiformis]|uniref:PARP-type domain-containing protein n=1 Tax=Apophysomyces ossiformis TaxID=679940 RepID=A0A8H7BYX5_9FUNG|nr:hypothetical protein EC973_009274 [Apophysomyces ossiformis]
MPYHLEYAKTGRSKCKGPKTLCHSEDRSIKAGELRFGVEVESSAFTGVSWKHWTCVTKQVITNMHDKLSGPEDIQGWEDLREEDKENVKEAWETGEVSRPEKPQETEASEETEAKKTEGKKTKKTSRKKASKEEEKTETKSQAGRKRKSEATSKDKEEQPKRKSQRKTTKKD